ncbi:MAG: hypothetical protein IKS84_06975 [Lachnospiraceae bacterium]|nr:hypothetical protein [Lachnospiraceae bacterium]
MLKILLYIISVIANAVYFVILRMDLYTDTYHLPDGEMGEHHRSPIDSLYTADNPALLYLQLALMLASVATSLLMIFGVRNNVVKVIQIASTIGSTAMFVIILIYTGNFVHPRY